ncbi:MAG TPA: hypothetical protein VJP58_09215 [Candidatus Nitrosocosmicus sp.]|nr:hypothetical protein [Candidatus Nitrosocosmicus sp.]
MEKINKKLPRGILIITILTIISGLLLVMMSVYAFNLLLPLGGVYLMGPAFLLILGIASLLTAYGLYMRKNWSWKLLLVLSGFGAAGYLLNVVNGQFISIFGVVYNAIIIYYMYRPHVRKYYGIRSKGKK